MKEFLALCVTRFEALERELNKLDAATGDGDHGTTILKGLRAAAAVDGAPDKAFRKAAGGASGSLFAQIIAALEKAADGASLGEALSQAADRIAMLGQAKPGEKTMLDALIPAAAAASPDEAAQAAATGRDATRDMPAKRGRAKYVEGAGVGHIDAGATSVAELLAIFAEWRRM
ncbi:DAK2 domain-containing protein [uncultured Roseobacter sp.]|uniref:DAK2 domain-containing protein n=1 Tax=uncultured Roseobacter sp. TaxID=114847 RepID=UPI0026234C17|nr:DAK2 domain-containing protein [uncultured Roseobacter sp.]